MFTGGVLENNGGFSSINMILTICKPMSTEKLIFDYVEMEEYQFRIKNKTIMFPLSHHLGQQVNGRKLKLN